MASADSVEIINSENNLNRTIIGYHRLRGYGGPWQFSVYAMFLDLTGLSLILFAVTGVILWLKILKNNILAWVIFLAGIIYTAIVIGYLLIV